MATYNADVSIPSHAGSTTEEVLIKLQTPDSLNPLSYGEHNLSALKSSTTTDVSIPSRTGSTTMFIQNLRGKFGVSIPSRTGSTTQRVTELKAQRSVSIPSRTGSTTLQLALAVLRLHVSIPSRTGSTTAYAQSEIATIDSLNPLSYGEHNVPRADYDALATVSIPSHAGSTTGRYTGRTHPGSVSIPSHAGSTTADFKSRIMQGQKPTFALT